MDEIAAKATPKQPRRSPIALLLAAVLLVILGVGAGLLLASSTQRGVQNATAPAVRAGTAPTTSAALSAGGQLPEINGISCDALESTIVHIHVHLAIFVDGEEQQIPFGIGIGQPWLVSATPAGPFVNDGSCFYWIHTHTDDGIVHIESPVRRRFTLGDFFAIWQLPLSSTQVGDARGRVFTYVNGQRTSGDPSEVTLLPHELIQLDVGTDVPPYQFDFPPGV